MDTERKHLNIYRSSKQGPRISNKKKLKKPKSNLDKGEGNALENYQNEPMC